MFFEFSLKGWKGGSCCEYLNWPSQPPICHVTYCWILYRIFSCISQFVYKSTPFSSQKQRYFWKLVLKSTPMIDDTKQNRRNQGQEKIIKEVIGIFFFNIWWLLKEPFCWWFLKTSVVSLAIFPDSPPLVEEDHPVQALWFVVVPLAIFPDSPPLVEGKILYKPCDFVDPFFSLVY